MVSCLKNNKRVAEFLECSFLLFVNGVQCFPICDETISLSVNTSRTMVSCRNNRRVAEFLECSFL